MVKKITKYLKFVVCCALILSLIAPSYAALSASDGSAFVTKAEFDSALADFNARLTTFEAGINSKIDSQVTSYLDRNGIWNGQDQTLVSGYADGKAIKPEMLYNFEEESEIFKSMVKYEAFWDTSMKGYGTRNTSLRKAIIAIPKADGTPLVENISKSGLAMVTATVSNVNVGGSQLLYGVPFQYMPNEFWQNWKVDADTGGRWLIIGEQLVYNLNLGFNTVTSGGAPVLRGQFKSGSWVIDLQQIINWMYIKKHDQAEDDKYGDLYNVTIRNAFKEEMKEIVFIQAVNYNPGVYQIQFFVSKGDKIVLTAADDSANMYRMNWRSGYTTGGMYTLKINSFAVY